MPSHRQLNIRDLIEEFSRSNVEAPNMDVLRSIMQNIAGNHVVWDAPDVLNVSVPSEEESVFEPGDAKAAKVRAARRRAGTKEPKVKNPEIGPGEEE